MVIIIINLFNMHYQQSMAAPELGAVLSFIFSTTTTTTTTNNNNNNNNGKM